MRGLRAVVVTVLGASLLAGCGSSSKSSSSTATSKPTTSTGTFPVTVKVAGASTVIAARPTRIVSLDPTATEDLFAIGAGSQVKVVDSLSDYPASAPRDSKLSAYSPNVEAIAGYNPDLVVISNDEDHIQEQLTKLHVPVLLLPAATSLSGAYQEISDLGTATGHTAQAATLVNGMSRSIASEVAKVKTTMASAPAADTRMSYYYELDTTYYSATSQTFIGQVMSQLGLTDIADSAKDTSDGYPQLSEEFVVHAAPSLVFTADDQGLAQLAKRPGWSQVPAVRNGDVIELNEDIASRWGPRLVQLVDQVGAAITKAERHK